MGLRPLACWDSVFKSRRGHGRPSHVSVACCQVEVSASGLSLVLSSTECGVPECEHDAQTMTRPWANKGCCAVEKTIHLIPRSSVSSEKLAVPQLVKNSAHFLLLEHP